MKRILLPTDFSKNSLNAIDYAMALFEKMPCEFYFLNIQKPTNYMSDELMTGDLSTSIYEAVSHDNKKQLENLTKIYSEKYKNCPFHFEARFDFDKLEDGIQQLVNQENIGLIIMGTNGATAAEEILFGSNTLRVIRKVQCPVLVIPEGFKFEGFSTLLFSLSEEITFHPDALTPISDFLRDHVVTLEVLQIDTEKVLPKSDILDRFAAISYHKLDGVPTEHAISSFEQLHPVDMHAIFIQPKSFFQRVFSKSDNSKISYKTRVPLLVLK